MLKPHDWDKTNSHRWVCKICGAVISAPHGWMEMSDDLINPHAKCPGTDDVQEAIKTIVHEDENRRTVWLYGGFLSWQEHIGGPLEREKTAAVPGRFQGIKAVSIHEQNGDAFVWTNKEAFRLFPPRHMEREYPGIPRDPDDGAVLFD